MVEKMSESELLAAASRVKLLLMDVDGVLTDGKLYNVPGTDGKLVETKAFDSQDGIALQWLYRYGIQTGMISGRVSAAAEERARQCRMAYVYQGYLEKVPIFEEILQKSGLSPEQVAYVGDDFTDAVIMRRAGLAAATANARAEVKRIAHLVTQAEGGRGAVREVAELLLMAQGYWDEILRKYEVEG